MSYALCIWKMCCNDMGRMEGQTADINTYDVGAGRGSFNVVVKTTGEIGKYVSGKLKDTSELLTIP